MLTVIWLAGTFGLLTDIATRFLGNGGPGTFGSIAIVFQSFLALVGGGTITRRGELIIDAVLARLNMPKRFRRKVIFSIATIILLLFIGFRALLPKIAVRYNNSAIYDFELGNLNSAESKLKTALELNPNYAAAHYNLGKIHQDLGREEEARVQYNAAIAGNFVAAYNNQARLSIIEGDFTTAVNLLEKGIALAKKNDTDQSLQNETSPIVEHDLWKNLGWARYSLGKGHLDDAESSLKIAINMAESNENLKIEPSPYCLLAQTYEKLEKEEEALIAWKGCLKYPKNINNPEEDEWQKLAEIRLNL